MKDDLTKSDIEKMKAEIEERKVVIRPKLLEDLKEARAQGDLSENFEYYAAKKAKNKNESRIRYLERMIKTANIIDDTRISGEVGINNRVTVEFTEDGTTESYKIVTTVRSNSLEGLISIDSPMGKALLKRKTGDVVTVNVSDDISYDVKIVSIDDEDDADDRIRSF
ncbi:MAG: transcription elongation factor GreA [Lachnospiraceae bacterium]|nr:transcription elongation factor GreA [Lachnospiraceae bacterium]